MFENQFLIIRSDSTVLESGIVIVQTKLKGVCTDGDVRLEDGDREYDGRIEICYNGELATLCDDGIDDPVAKIVCRQLGFSSHSKNS